MRENLFRGKRTNNGEWKYGWYCEATFGSWPLLPAIILADDARNGYYRPVKVDSFTVGEFTGLTDKNDKRIFEGDIVKTKYGRICKVMWFSSEQYSGWDLVPVNEKYSAPDKWDLFYKKNLEVIGNIHDNPYLMEDENS